MLAVIKTILGFKDDTNDELLNAIISLTTARLLLLIGATGDVPESLQYIVVEVTIARFNRIGSEGLNSHTVEGESMSWSDGDFEPFENDIRNYLAENGKGKVRFL